MKENLRRHGGGVGEKICDVEKFVYICYTFHRITKDVKSVFQKTQSAETIDFTGVSEQVFIV